MPEMQRQAKNQGMGSGQAQAAKLSARATQHHSSTRSAPRRSASGAAASAPIR